MTASRANPQTPHPSDAAAPAASRAIAPPLRRRMACWLYEGMLMFGVVFIAGYLFGNVPVVKQNFSVVVVAIVVLSLMPAVLGVIRHRREAAAPRSPAGS